ncbi:MAG: tyrosine--tRNA ligase [Pseudomonadota bacterium]|nr:MAG: tyrosine--tRNA ligase [Pseudomonadota bacterium]
MTDILSDLERRNLCYQQTNPEGLREHLATSRSLYCGFDPTAPSLTVGHLVPLLVLARFQRAGHRPVALLGGATALIGDPSGKSAERPFLSREEVAANVEALRPIFERVLDFSGSYAASVVNNADWLAPLTFLEVLRDVGKHFSVNMMIQKDSVRERLENREQGISYTEFSYLLLQAMDFRHLFDTRGVTLQVAGSDQWGNIVAGVDLVRRTRRAEVFGLTSPLLTKADGGKFGKTESGAVWLTADRTSPYAFYQFWLNSADADVERYLLTFTFLEPERVRELREEQARDPGKRVAQRTLAAHVTEIVHGPTARAQAEATTEALFSGDVRKLPRQALEEAFENAPSAVLPATSLAAGVPLVDVLVSAEVTKSKREARELLASGAILVNGERAALETVVTRDSLLYGELLLVRRGKKHWHVVRATG